jgi:hypothetical protein
MLETEGQESLAEEDESRLFLEECENELEEFVREWGESIRKLALASTETSQPWSRAVAE